MLNCSARRSSSSSSQSPDNSDNQYHSQTTLIWFACLQDIFLGIQMDKSVCLDSNWACSIYLGSHEPDQGPDDQEDEAEAETGQANQLNGEEIGGVKHLTGHI